MENNENGKKFQFLFCFFFFNSSIRNKDFPNVFLFWTFSATHKKSQKKKKSRKRRRKTRKMNVFLFFFLLLLFVRIDEIFFGVRDFD